MSSSQQPLLGTGEGGKRQQRGVAEEAEEAEAPRAPSVWVRLSPLVYAINLIFVFGGNLNWWGKDNKEVSESYTTLITPAGWAFAIWGPIFVTELFYVIFLLTTQGKSSRLTNEGVQSYFVLANVVQSAWSVVFAQELLTAAAILLVVEALLLSLAVRGMSSFAAFSREWFLVHFPIGLHAGWVCAAAIVNVNLSIAAHFSLTAQIAASLTSLALCSMISLLGTRWGSTAYVASISWALGAISTNNDVRTEILGKEVADGFSWSLAIVAVLIASLHLVGNVFTSKRAGRFIE
jgi:hypothetical protein